MAAQPSIYRSASGREAILALYEKILAAWPVPSRRLCVATRHGETFVIASGDEDAPPLILLHGSGSNSATWAGDVRRYALQYRVYAVDIPGEAGKSAETRFSCRGPAFREWLDDVFDGLGVAQAVLGGMSLGAWAALDYAAYRPERVGKALLICPAGVCPPRPGFGLAALIYLPLGDWGIERMKRLVFKDAVLPADAERFFVLTAKYFRFRMEAPEIMSDEVLRRVTMPALFLAGEDDAILPSRKTAARLQRLLPQVRTHVYPSDGHAVLGVTDVVLAFLGESRPAVVAA